MRGPVLFILPLALALSVALSLLLRIYGLSHYLWWLGIPTFLALNLAVYFIYQLKKEPADKISITIASAVGRFLLSLIVVLIAFLIQKGGFLAFFTHFAGHWLLFTLAEIAYLPVSHKHAGT